MRMFSGGTLGLFIGASFTSVVEVIFWMLKIFFGRNSDRRAKNHL